MNRRIPRPERATDATLGPPDPSRVVTQAEVESEIVRLSDAMSEATHTELPRLAQAWADAHVAYRVAKAKANLKAQVLRGSGKGGHTTVDERQAYVDLSCEAEMHVARTTEAFYEVGKEKLRTMRAQIDALRTISANIRSQT